MNPIVEDFKKNSYLHVQNVISRENCELYTRVLIDAAQKSGKNDEQCPLSKSIRDNPVFDQLLLDMLPQFEEITGLKLLPTYAYARLYAPDDELKIHLDRESCEISATITLGFDGEVWPILIGTPTMDKDAASLIDDYHQLRRVRDIRKIEMNVGDAMVYRGRDMYHWREKYKQGKWQAQVFLHYVDANGPYKDWIYDKRPGLNLQPAVEAVSDDLTYWVYNDVLTHEDCEALIKGLTTLKSEVADVGVDSNRSKVDTEIRNVQKVILPTYKGIGAILTAVGMDANRQRWQFDIDGANQCEFLNYPAGGGRYKGHIDTFLSNLPAHTSQCRKLTVLAFLNEDYTGGKFFLQVGSNKIYPPQEKGNVLVFPSFLLHGVEDVVEGERYSVVCWLVGPWFK